MKSIYIRKNIILFSYNSLLFLALILYSKTITINNLSLNSIDEHDKYKEGNEPREIYEKCEELREKQKKLDKELASLVKNNKDKELQIEVNKIYIRILYILISICLFIIISIIIFKFYTKCKKEKMNAPLITLKDKYSNNESISNINNINSN